MDFIHQVEPYLTEKEQEAVSEYLRSGGWLTEFRKTEEFEKMIAEFLGVKYCSVITNGTVGLYLALLASGIGKGDKVIVPNFTMIATINAVVWAGAEPVIVDINRDNLCMNFENLRLDVECKALIYVPINGRSGDMSEVMKFCNDHKLVLIEDACQSLASRWQDKFFGTFGSTGVFSFTPHKIITTGQGGAVVTNDERVYERLEKLKDFHRTAPGIDSHDGIGYNFKFTDLQAVVGIEQMKIIDERMRKKKKLFQTYQQGLAGVEGVKMLNTNIEQTTPWFVDILLTSKKARDDLQAYLKKCNIGTRVFYPPLNHQDPFSHFRKGSFPVSEELGYRGLWLPSSVGLEYKQVSYICGAVKDFFYNQNVNV